MKLKRIAAPVLTILISTSSSFAYETTGLSTVCVGDCASKLNQLKAEAKADAVKKVKQVPDATIKETLDTGCKIVSKTRFATQCTAKVIYDVPRKNTPVRGPDCQNNPYASGCPGVGGALTPLHRCAPRHRLSARSTTADGSTATAGPGARITPVQQYPMQAAQHVTANENFADR